MSRFLLLACLSLLVASACAGGGGSWREPRNWVYDKDDVTAPNYRPPTPAAGAAVGGMGLGVGGGIGGGIQRSYWSTPSPWYPSDQRETTTTASPWTPVNHAASSQADLQQQLQAMANQLRQLMQAMARG